jgi:hypothetical protein
MSLAAPETGGRELRRLESGREPGEECVQSLERSGIQGGFGGHRRRCIQVRRRGKQIRAQYLGIALSRAEESGGLVEARGRRRGRQNLERESQADREGAVCGLVLMPGHVQFRIGNGLW